MLQTASDARTHGQYDKAERYFQMALDDGETKHPDDTTIAISASAYGDMQAGRGKWADAERLYKQALEMYQKHLGPASPDVKKIRGELANVLVKEGKGKEAKQLLAEDKPASPPPEKEKQGRARPRRHSH